MNTSSCCGLQAKSSQFLKVPAKSLFLVRIGQFKVLLQAEKMLNILLYRISWHFGKW